MRELYAEMSLQTKARHRSNLTESFVQGCLEKQQVSHLFVVYILSIIHDILVEIIRIVLGFSCGVDVFKRGNGFCGHN